MTRNIEQEYQKIKSRISGLGDSDMIEVDIKDLEVNPLVQHENCDDIIKGYALGYSLNVESELLNQLSPEQQKIWHKEIEKAVTNGCQFGLEISNLRS